VYYRVGPYRLIQNRAGWRVRWTKLQFGGAVCSIPSSFATFRWSIGCFTAGGPAASLFQAIVCGFAAWLSHSPTPFWIFAFTAHMALLIGIFNLVPCRQGLQFSDGEQLRRALRGGALLDELKRVSLAEMSMGTPLRPRDWLTELMAQVLDTSTICTPYDRYLAYVHLLDSDNADAAFPWLARYAAEWTKADPGEHAVKAAYYLGVYQHNRAAADLWLKRASTDKSLRPADRLRAQAAAAWAGGRNDEAERLARAALVELDEELPNGWVEYQRARLNYLLQRVAATAPDAMIVG